MIHDPLLLWKLISLMFPPLTVCGMNFRQLHCRVCLFSSSAIIELLEMCDINCTPGHLISSDVCRAVNALPWGSKYCGINRFSPVPPRKVPATAWEAGDMPNHCGRIWPWHLSSFHWHFPVSISTVSIRAGCNSAKLQASRIFFVLWSWGWH